MRDHAIVSARFWTGDTGRFLRQFPNAQRVALYLITCPSSNMIGLYYLPIPTICHEIGMTEEDVRESLRRASEGDFADYDDASETVFVKNMARFQVGEKLKKTDNRIRSIVKQLELYRKSKFFNDFMSIYGRPYQLNSAFVPEPPSKPLQRGSIQDQDQDQDQEYALKPPLPADAVPQPSGAGANGHAQARQEEIRQAEKLAELRRFATGWLTANHPQWLRKTGSLIDMLSALGQENGISEAEVAIAEAVGNSTIRDPFSYALPRALERQSKGITRRSSKPRSAAAAEGREDN